MDPDKLTSLPHPSSKYGPLSQQTPEDIWIKLAVTIHHQLQVDASEIRYNAHLRNDLGAD